MLVEEADGKPRLTFRSRAGQAVLEDVSVEIASEVLQEGDRWGALAASELLELDDDDVPHAVSPAFAKTEELVELAPRERMGIAFGKLAAAVTALIAHLADGTRHITAAERSAWNGVADAAHAHVSDTTRHITSAERGAWNAAHAAANAAMPRAGGQFTGNVLAAGTNRAGASLRNSEVYHAGMGAHAATDRLIFVRK